MSDPTTNSEVEKRMALAKRIFVEQPGVIPKAHQDAILMQHVVPGMTPYEAYLAAGAFAFRVVADPNKWPAHSDPYRVMWAQSQDPDKSDIWMTFQNDTQYRTEGKRTFRVAFENGRAKSIEQVPHEAGGS